MAKKKPSNVIAANKRARFDYHLIETFEAGLALEGWEVKSLRSGKAQLPDSYVKQVLIGVFHVSMIREITYHYFCDFIEIVFRHWSMIFNVWKTGTDISQKTLFFHRLTKYTF